MEFRMWTLRQRQGSPMLLEANAVSARSESCENSVGNVCSNFASLVHDVWHKRLGHMSHGKMSIVSEHAKFHDKKRQYVCEVCPEAKQHGLPFPINHISSTYTFGLLHVDTWGPYHTKTHIGHRYFLTVVDDYWRATWTHLMVTKDEAFPLIKALVAMDKTQFGGISKPSNQKMPLR